MGNNDTYSVTSRVSSKQYAKLKELQQYSGYPISDLISIAVDLLYESSPWPRLIPSGPLDEFTEKLRLAGTSLAQWAAAYEIKIPVIYKIFREVAAGNRPGSVTRRFVPETSRALREIERVLERDLY
jgi:hypothetical protein